MVVPFNFKLQRSLVNAQKHAGDGGEHAGEEAEESASDGIGGKTHDPMLAGGHRNARHFPVECIDNNIAWDRIPRMGRDKAVKDIPWWLRVKEVVLQAHLRMQTRLVSVLVLHGAVFVLLAITYSLSIFVVFRITYVREYQQILLNIAAMPVTAYLVTVLLKWHGQFSRGQDPDWKAALKPSLAYVHIFVLCLAYYLLYVLLVKAMFDYEESPILIQMRTFGGFLLFLWAGTRVCFSFLYALEDSLNFKDAIKASFLTTSGRFWRTFGWVFLAMLLVVAGLLALGIGIVYALPLVAFLYIRLFDRSKLKATDLAKKNKVKAR